MQIRFHRNFEKAFCKLSPKIQNKVLEAIENFQKDPLDPALKNHALKGMLTGKRAFSVTGDLRIIFEEYGSYTIVLMLDVGTHNQVY